MKYELALGYDGPQMHMREDHFCHVCGHRALHMTGVGMGDGVTVELKCENCKATAKLTNAAPWRGRELTEVEVDGIFNLAGIGVFAKWKLQNKYWGNTDNAYPWWLVKTNFGLVEIGWRKHVISIDWTHSEVRCVVTPDEVTKGDDHVHAYSLAKAAEYMTAWKAATARSAEVNR